MLMNFHIPKKLKNDLEKFCKKSERNMSESIRLGIRKLIEKEEKNGE